MSEMERRSFLKTAAAAGAAIAGAGLLGGCAKTASSTEVEEKWDKEADVVIVGGGGTGLAAAVEAAKAGAKVLVLEKGEEAGGTTKLSGGMIHVAGTKYQKEFKGYEGDTPEKLFKYYMAAGAGEVDEELVRDYVDGTNDNLAWLEGQGIKYVNVFAVKPVPNIPLELSEPPRIHIPGDETTGTEAAAGTGRVHTDALFKTATDAGATFEYKTEVTSLIADADNGVIGVIAKNAEGDFRVKAKKGVVIATGGIDHNVEMAHAVSPQHYDTLTTKVKMCIAAKTNTGDGIRMSLAVGAALAGLGGCINTPINTIIGRDPGGSTGNAIPGIGVNIWGERFANEWTTYPYYFRRSFEQDTHNTWIIFDQAVADLGAEKIGLGGVDWSKDVTAGGGIATAPTLRELAEKIGVNPDGLEATVAKWNEDMKTSGKDTIFGKLEGLAPIEKPPFYSAADWSANLGTIGGLKINKDAQVLDWAAKPIPRLFAGGMCTGGWIGQWYPGSGTAVGGTVHWGRKAGKGAAKLEAWD